MDANPDTERVVGRGLAAAVPWGEMTTETAKIGRNARSNGHGDVHDEASSRLAEVDQRYTRGRRVIIDVLAAATRPLTVPEISELAPDASLPVSSAYRNLTILVEAGVVERVIGSDEHGRYELAEVVSHHHHHLLCTTCGAVADVAADGRLERALAAAADAAQKSIGFDVTAHRLDLLGTCRSCRA